MSGKVIVILGVCFCAFGSIAMAQNDKNTYNIALTIEGVEDSVAYMGFLFGDKKYSMDTADVASGGKVVFSGDEELTPGVYFYYSKSFYFEFIVDETHFAIQTNKDDLYSDMVIKNSISNEHFKKFRLTMADHQRKVSELTSELDSMATKEDSISTFNKIRELNEQNLQNRLELEQGMGDIFLAQLLKLMRMSPQLKFDEGDSSTIEEKRAQYVKFRSGYWDEIDFDSKGLLRTPLFDAKLNEYVDKVVFQNPDSIVVAIDELLAKSNNNEPLYRYIMRVMFQKYQNPKIMGMDKVFVHLSDNYYLKGKAPWADEKMIKELQEEMVFHRQNQLGMQAPQINMVDTLDNAMRLYDVRAEYLILYFYSPTCGHCKKKTPVLKAAYDRLEGKTEVAAICVDTDVDKWKKFIQEFDLTWLNYADPSLRSNFRVQYNVRSTPVIYILDKDKKIIAKKLDVDQVEGFINDQIQLKNLSRK